MKLYSPKYAFVKIVIEGKKTQKLVHRLVLEAFVGPCPDGMECRHLDGNPTNNKLENLCWGTHEENWQDQLAHGKVPFGERHHNSKLTAEQVEEIKKTQKSFKYVEELADKFGVCKKTIYNIRNGVCRTNG